MKTTLMAIAGTFLLVTAATAAPPLPVQAPTQSPAPSKSAMAPAQVPVQAPAKSQANAAYAAPNMAYSGGYRTYSYQPSDGYRGYSYQPSSRRPVTGAGFNPAGYKSAGMWRMP